MVTAHPYVKMSHLSHAVGYHEWFHLDEWMLRAVVCLFNIRYAARPRITWAVIAVAPHPSLLAMCSLPEECIRADCPFYDIIRKCVFEYSTDIRIVTGFDGAIWGISCEEWWGNLYAYYAHKGVFDCCSCVCVRCVIRSNEDWRKSTQRISVWVWFLKVSQSPSYPSLHIFGRQPYEVCSFSTIYNWRLTGIPGLSDVERIVQISFLSKKIYRLLKMISHQSCTKTKKRRKKQPKTKKRKSEKPPQKQQRKIRVAHVRSTTARY